MKAERDQQEKKKGKGEKKKKKQTWGLPEIYFIIKRPRFLLSNDNFVTVCFDFEQRST